MLGKCINPSCSASFRSLKEGRLFRLENDPNLQVVQRHDDGVFLAMPLLLVNDDSASERRRNSGNGSAPRGDSWCP
jgi:hypothetical protein